MEWWRCKHGAPVDPKWRAIGARINVAPGVVWAVFSALCDRASQAAERGSIVGYDPEDIAAAFGFDVGEVERTIKALKAKGVIDEASITNWTRHQPKREDLSTGRVRAWRERDAKKRRATRGDATQRGETHGNAREDETREEGIYTQCGGESVGAATRTPSKASRWPSDAVVPDEWIAAGHDARRNNDLPPIDLQLEAVQFANYWAAKSGAGAAKRDWRKTWINWSLKAYGNRKPSGDDFYSDLARRLDKP